MAAPPQPGTERRNPVSAYLEQFRLREGIVLAPLALIGIALGAWGFDSCGVECKVDGTWAQIVRSIGLIRPSGGYSHPWQLVIAQFLMPGLFLFGAAKLVFFNLRRDMRVVLAGRHRRHTIVCGLGQSGRQIVENLHAAGKKVVAITLDDQAANAIACERLRIPVLKGDATQLGMLRLAGLQKADALVVTCGSDAVNVEIALRVGVEFRASGERSRPLHVFPELRSVWLLELLRNHPTATLSAGAAEVRPFDVAANSARLLLQNPAFGRLARAVPGQVQPHLLIAGLGDVGMQVIAQAVQTNFALPGTRLSVTVLDQQGEDSATVLDARYPGLKGLIDREFVPVMFAADKPGAWQKVWQAVEAALDARQPGWTTVAVVIALKDDTDALHTALQLRERLDRKGYAGTPVFVRLREQQLLGQFAASLDGPHGVIERLTPFGDLGVATGPDLLFDETQDRLAHAMHEVYRTGGQPSAEADVPWARLPEYLKQSNRAFANHIAVKLGAVGMRLVDGAGPPFAFTAAEIEAMSEIEHHRWVTERLAAGWSFDAERDPVARHHPNLVPWAELDDSVREIDRVLVRGIVASVAAAGMAIRRARIIDATGDGLASAQAALASAPSGEQAVIIFDPLDDKSREFAQAASAGGAKLWVRWREGSHAALTMLEEPTEALRGAVELAISEREVAALFADVSG